MAFLSKGFSCQPPLAMIWLRSILGICREEPSRTWPGCLRDWNQATVSAHTARSCVADGMVLHGTGSWLTRFKALGIQK